ncbi:MAG: caspase family protein [Deltaproteobacteria bacterium]|nr:caspase family protein [Deltaproteobacteria bacterium]
MGTIISYSTSPGDVALDGKGRNSPYTSSLLKYVKEPALSIEQVFKNVRQKLTKETNGKQIPWELSSLQGDFFFLPGVPRKGSVLKDDKSETTSAATDELDDENRQQDVKQDIRFVDNGDGTVMDNQTGLMWAARDNGANINWHDAQSY